jgi:hypothetical protein
MVSDGFTPKEVGIIDPSATYSSGYVSFPFLSLKVFPREFYPKHKLDMHGPMSIFHVFICSVRTSPL